MQLRVEAVSKACLKLTGMVFLDQELIKGLHKLCSEKMNDYIQWVLALTRKQFKETGKKHISMDSIFEAKEKFSLADYSRINVIRLKEIDDPLCEDFYFPSAFEKSKFHSCVNRIIEDTIMRNHYWSFLKY